MINLAYLRRMNREDWFSILAIAATIFITLIVGWIVINHTQQQLQSENVKHVLNYLT